MLKRLTNDEFIQRAKAVHGDKYDYSKVEYKGFAIKVCIICPIHGEFWQAPSKHLSGQGCKECMKLNLREKFADTKEKFIEKAKKIHGDKYNYSKVEYINNATKVCIICPIHGEFWMTPANHTSPSTAQGCPKCGAEINHSKLRRTTEEFIKRAREVHGDKYDYSKVNYINNATEVCIICSIHGEFWMTPINHINKGCKCPNCTKTGKRYAQETIIEAFRKVYGGTYDYSKVEYKTVHDKVCVICPIHGEFWMTPDSHLRGRGCPKCGRERIGASLRMSDEEFIKRAREIHGDKYMYDDMKYQNLWKPIKIKCSIHGMFEQRPSVHLRGCGCPQCGNISICESEVERILDENNISYIKQYKFDWLKYKHRLPLDFYLPEFNIAIECQGIQHFKPVYLFGGEKQFKKQQELDNIKKQLCEDNNIKIIYYSNFTYDFPYEVINEKEQLLNKIKKYGEDIKKI